MNLLLQRLCSVFSVFNFLARSRPRSLPMEPEPDTDLERYLFCRDLRFSSGPPRK